MLALALPLAQVVRADDDKGNHKKKNKHQAEAAAPNGAQQAAPKVRQPVKQVPPPKAAHDPAFGHQRHRARRRRPSATITHAPRPVTPAAQSQPVKSEAQSGRTESPEHDRIEPVPGQSHEVDDSVNAMEVGTTIIATAITSRCNYVVRTPHNRNWWRSRYNTTFVLFGGGYYYWWNNYWYPAYGYSPYYNNYVYSEPIYGYNNLAPGQVIENVQLALRDQGYYPGAIDGLIGPQTRAALAAFQRDHGLIVTSAVDEPTLVTLGLA